MNHGIFNKNLDIGRGEVVDNVSKESEIPGQQRRLLHRDNGPEELATTREGQTKENEPEVLTTTIEASIEQAEDTSRPSKCLQRRRRQCVYGIRVLTTTSKALPE